MSSFVRRLGLALAANALLLNASLRAQTPDPDLDAQTAAALHSIAAEAQRLRESLAQALEEPNPDRVSELRSELRTRRWDFAELASHMDVQAFEQPSSSKLQLEQELVELIAPLIEAVKDATAEPREVAALRKRANQLQARRAIAIEARLQTTKTRDALPDGSVEREEAQRELEQRWTPMLADLDRELLIVNANLRRREQLQVSVWTRTASGAQRFLQNSGLNVLLCVTTFLLSYFGLRWISNRALRRKRDRGFSIRLTEVLLRVFTLLVAVAATMAVLYSRNDWLLLPVAVIFLIGAGWVVIKGAPIFFEQVRLILNVGPVREGERLLVNGLPYSIQSLRFYSKLVNPALSGGILRIPVKDLVGMRSRPSAPKEPWFPCDQGEVVALSDGVVGVVSLQTPEVVVIIQRNDAPRYYPTLTFLSMNPRNLSHGFEITLTFGIDYAHLTEAFEEVPRALTAALEAGIQKITEADQLRSVRVEIEAAGTSSIDYAVLVHFDGDAAPRYHHLHRAVNKLLMSTCAEHGFGIPFPQLQVHGINGQSVSAPKQ